MRRRCGRGRLSERGLVRKRAGFELSRQVGELGILFRDARDKGGDLGLGDLKWRAGGAKVSGWPAEV